MTAFLLFLIFINYSYINLFYQNFRLVGVGNQNNPINRNTVTWFWNETNAIK